MSMPDGNTAALARHELEQEQTGRATETAWSRRAELVANWIVTTGRDFGEIMMQLMEDDEARACIQRAVGAVGRGADAVRLAAMNRLCELAMEKADAYTGDDLVEREARQLMEDADDARLRSRG